MKNEELELALYAVTGVLAMNCLAVCHEVRLAKARAGASKAQSLQSLKLIAIAPLFALAGHPEWPTIRVYLRAQFRALAAEMERAA